MIIHLFPDVDPTSAPISGFDIPGEIAKITLSGAGFIASGGSAQLNPGFTGTKPNPFYRAYVQSEDGTARGEIYRAGKYGIEYYKYNGDPRIDRFYVKPAGATVHKGIPFGKPSDATGEFTGEKLSTNRGPGILPSGATSRAWILTSVESLFLQAEATERGILPGGGVGTASALLTQAVEESFIWLGLTSADGDTYLSGNATYPDVDYSATGGGLFTILSQKWFALNTLAPFEIYTDFRRTDYVLGTKVQYDAGPPISVDPAVNPATAKIPVRLFYPQNEYNYNAANVGAEGAISVFNNRIFWDKQ